MSASAIWVYLAASPLLGLTLTLLAYLGASAVHQRCGGHPLANPVLLAVAALVGLLWLTDTPWHTYFDGAQFVHFLLGPATVALAIPLHAQLPRLRRMALPLLLALLVGSLTAALSAVAIGALLGASRATLLSLAPKSVTTPIAMGIAERIGGLPSLTAVLVILTGVLGAILARYIHRALHIDAEREQMGAFAALAMGLNGLLTAVLLPLLLPLLLA